MSAPGSFLYPMLSAEQVDPAALLADLAQSARGKAAESLRIRSAALADSAAELERTATAMARRFAAGGRLLAFGNGGSATDAAGLAGLFTSPCTGTPLPARSLAADPAVVTALCNDIGVDAVFARQLIAHGRAGDIALGLSTSGGSANVLNAFVEARRRGLLTVGLAGYGGGAVRAGSYVDHCLTVDAQSVHRTQEAQSALAHALWVSVQARLDDEGLG